MASLINHADGIVRDVRAAPEFNEYPKMMTHPAYDPGSIGDAVQGPGGFTHHINGRPSRLPPVLVKTPDDEEFYASRGYVSQGKSDAAAFHRAHTMAHAAPPIERQEYPKWAGGIIVNNAEEEEEALAGRRAQLGLEEAAAAEAETEAVVAEAAPGEVDALKATIRGLHTELREGEASRREQAEEMAAMKAQMAQMMEMLTAPVTTPTEPPAAEAPTRGQKGWETRQRRAAERAGAGDVAT